MATTKFNHSGTTNQADTISSLLIKGNTTQAEVMDLIRVGIQLHFIKDNSPHGEFMNRLAELGIAHRTAIDAMRIALNSVKTIRHVQLSPKQVLVKQS